MANKRGTVLIVDDCDSTRETLAAHFKAAGWETAMATDGEEFFRVFTAHEPDAVLLDVVMPKINGGDVCRLIKGHPDWRQTYVVVMSATISERDEAAYRKSGADEVLRKPFDPSHAVDLVNRARGGG
jgi:DNA-binding response OmpR family regulator